MFSVFGIRHCCPKLSDPPRVLQSNDAVHYLVEDDSVSARLEYAQELGRLNITVLYKPYRVTWDLLSSPQMVPTERLKQTIVYNTGLEDSNNNSNSSISDNESNTNSENNNIHLLSAWFEREGKLLQVSKFERNNLVLCTFEDATTVQLEKGLVCRLVTKYIE